MEQFFWVFVKRMLQPLYKPVQTYKVTAFDWTPAHWAQMAEQSRPAGNTRHTKMLAEKVEHQRLVDDAAKRAKRQDDADVGTFEL